MASKIKYSLLYIILALLCGCVYADELDDANTVLELSLTDNVEAAKKVTSVFLAAKKLHSKKQYELAEEYYIKGLQLSPWSIDEQMAYAQLLNEMGKKDQAIRTSKAVHKVTENSRLYYESAELANMLVERTIMELPKIEFTEKVFCFVRMGSVDDWIIELAGSRLNKTLGVRTFVYPKIVQLPEFDRSYYNKWVKNIRNGIQWKHPFIISVLGKMGISDLDLISSDQVLDVYLQTLQSQGHENIKEQLESAKTHAQQNDKQWDANNLYSVLKKSTEDKKNVVYIGITQADLYANDSNYIFGISVHGSEYALVSYKRYLAAFNGERENQDRLLNRIHKQLLSSVGFALNIPRPTNPMSARSYPASLADHDQKGTWLSIESIEGFEKALGKPLPAETRSAAQ